MQYAIETHQSQEVYIHPLASAHAGIVVVLIVSHIIHVTLSLRILAYNVLSDRCPYFWIFLFPSLAHICNNLIPVSSNSNIVSRRETDKYEVDGDNTQQPNTSTKTIILQTNHFH